MVATVIAALRSGAIDGSLLQSAGDWLSVDAALVSAQETEHLKATLLAALQQEQNPSRAAALIWALGKSADPNLKEIYLEYLRHFAENPEASGVDIYQILIALDNLGEPVFERDIKGHSSQSVLDADKNLHQARTYLRLQGSETPGQWISQGQLACQLDAGLVFSV